MTTSIQDAYPVRQKGIHFINPSGVFDAVFKIFYGFLSDKIKQRVSETKRVLLSFYHYNRIIFYLPRSLCIAL